MEFMELSITYIDIATSFQSLTPHLQTEFLQLLQDEYTLDNQPLTYDEVETREDYEYYIIYHIVEVFYIHYNEYNLSSILENTIYELYENDNNTLQLLLNLANSLKGYLDEL